jgi:hypothetical protein
MLLSLVCYAKVERRAKREGRAAARFVPAAPFPTDADGHHGRRLQRREGREETKMF